MDDRVEEDIFHSARIRTPATEPQPLSPMSDGINAKRMGLWANHAGIRNEISCWVPTEPDVEIK